jgi:hypothetical protein
MKEKNDIQNYNKLLITINQDLLDKFVEKDDVIYKVKDFSVSVGIARRSEVKIQRVFD